MTDNCTDPVFARGMCMACYSWDRYHVKNRHGIEYFRRYVRKNARLMSRAESRLGAHNIRVLVKKRKASG